MPIIAIDIDGLATYIVSNLNGGFPYAWWCGTHTGLIVINDKNPNGEESFLYDPSGSYTFIDNWGNRRRNGNSIQYAGDDGAINITDYYKYQALDGSSVKIYFFRTTESDEQIMLKEAELWGEGSGFDCTDSISYILSKTKKLKTIKQVTCPNSLSSQLEKMK
jgi:hypothetical protein